jgi:superfamily II RNA helicase
MFSMGRFDPRAEVVEVQKSKEESIIAKGKPEEESDLKEQKSGDKPNSMGCNSDGNSSSSVPSSDASSSSAPSTDDESDKEDEPAMKVIAPEQQYEGVGTKRKRNVLTDEGMDDFDEDEVIHVQKSPEEETALRLSKRPIREVAKLWKLAPFLVHNLEEDEYDTFFPIQALVIPDVIASERHSHIRNRDVCVSAPTGSGKTLSFVLPVLNSLAGRRVKRLRALVVLPSRDLGEHISNIYMMTLSYPVEK